MSALRIEPIQWDTQNSVGETEWFLEKVKVSAAGEASEVRKGNHENCCVE